MTLRERRDDAIADGEFGHAGADGGDLTRSVGQRDRVLLERTAKVLAGQDREIAEIQRRRTHPHEHLARSGGRPLALAAFEAVETRRTFGDREDLHDVLQSGA